MQVENSEKKTKFGYIGVFGRANAGKSTLVNSLVEADVSIVSPRPQTTRKRILGIITRDVSQIVFCDTPGLHPVKNKLDSFMNSEIASVPDNICAGLYLIDSFKPVLSEDSQYIDQLFSTRKVPLIGILTKTDLSKPPQLNEVLESVLGMKKFQTVLAISALKTKGIGALWETILPLVPEGPHCFPEDDYTTQTEREICEEIIRQEVLNRYFQEVPHSVAVTIEEFKERDSGKTFVSAVLNVEKEGHKKIIIGKNGDNLKALGVSAREKLNSQLGRDIYLELWVKVRHNWRKSEDWIRKLGYVNAH
ncbi:MAG: GTPase Era [Candidatus Riflebacteria bacterium]|nr:GTPase Era [Candidatus Riflebacteria bacterium]